MRMADVRSNMRCTATRSFGTGQRSTRTEVDAVPERKMLPSVGPVGIELRRFFELARVAVGGTVDDHHGGTGRNVDATDRRRALSRAGSRL